ncbi:TnsD family transposase [Pseudomonas cichorii]|nr:TnsD family transposase [Pseudomonas cichorii]
MGLKFHFFPTAFPDETLHSVLSRYARLCGGGSRKAAFAGELAANSFTQNVVFPSRLGDLVESLPSGTDLTVARIINRHTVLPYYSPFLTIDQLQDAQASMAGDGGGLMLKLGINASRIEYASRVRFCPECLSEDISRGGAAYWHRVHQLPGVLVCPHHGQLLKFLDPGWCSRNSRQLNLPNDDCVQTHSVQIDVSAAVVSKLHQIALSSLQLLSLELSPLPASALRACLLKGAIRLDLAFGAKSRLGLGGLGAHMTRFFDALPDAWEYSVLRESPAALPATWVTKLLRRPRGTHHPLKYIVLANALNVDLAHISCSCKLQVPEDERPSPTTAWPSQTVSVQPLAEPSEGLRAAIWDLALAGHEARQIAGTLGISQISIYRWIRSVKGGPAAWQEARFTSERRRRRASFEDDYPCMHARRCRAYSWLYRHDRAWLSGYIDNHSNFHAGRPDSTGKFATLDSELAQQISCCAQRLRALPGKPVRISRTRIGRELHALSRFEKQLSKLPLCTRALDQVCESSEQFHARRLQWAETKLEGEQRNLTRSALYRTACIRPRDLDRLTF